MVRSPDPIDCVRRGFRLDVSRDVAVGADVAAEALRDTRTWTAWSPTVTGVESDDRYVREGTTGRVRVAGVWVPFRVTDFNGRRWAWDVARIPATGHRVEAYAGSDDRCRVVIEVPLVAAGYVPVCELALDRFARLVERPAAEGV
ncbi:SRPBCC family protein [Halorubrum sp. DTA98]|uniref:SRPBCC family protein n=1 Tax=Halorubrum sp. DTA98 TaxID=3402163 RepID=UPI003AAE2DDE